jgi:hypothetical protein
VYKEHLEGDQITPLRICPNPVFIIGSPRSGTTILAVSLGQHSELWTSEESDFLFDLFGDGKVEAVYQRALERPKPSWLKANRTSRAEFLSYLGCGVNALFTSRSNKKRWIEQTPRYGQFADILAEMFPGAQFVHILRDPRRVIHSMINVTRRYSKETYAAMVRTGRLPQWPDDFRSACLGWRTCVQKSLAFCKSNPTRGITVSYEALVKDPRAEFAVLQDFLKLKPEDAPAKYFGETRINSSFHPDFSKPAAEDFIDEPWMAWTFEHKQTFISELREMLIKEGLTDCLALGARTYDELVEQTVAYLRALLPTGATALIISKGDERFTNIEDRRVWHFPRDPSGLYAGPNPANSADAIEQLELLRKQGAQWLVIPHTCKWWLEHYHEFAVHLGKHSQRVARQEGLCTVYSLGAIGL